MSRRGRDLINRGRRRETDSGTVADVFVLLNLVGRIVQRVCPHVARMDAKIRMGGCPHLRIDQMDPECTNFLVDFFFALPARHAVGFVHMLEEREHWRSPEPAHGPSLELARCFMAERGKNSTL